MPISKKGNKYYTAEQLKRAKECSALDYAQDHHYDLIQQGSRFVHRDHDSMIFLLDGRWYWNSKCVSGRALDLLVYFEEWPLVDAVLYLAGDDECRRPDNADTRQVRIERPPPAPFLLPSRSKTHKHLFAYLCGYRKLDVDIVRKLVQDNRLYESVHVYQAPGDSVWRECFNVVFLGLDTAGTPQSAYQRGASSKSTFKCEVPSSKKLEHPFIIPGQASAEAVGFFEASIDAISHATVYKLYGVDYTVMERVAMGGIVPDTIIVYLKQHPEKRQIHFCLDSDKGGIAGTDSIERILREKGYSKEAGYTFTREQVPKGKDWNEYLMTTAPP